MNIKYYTIILVWYNINDMEIKGIENKDIEVTKDIICDCCGNSCKSNNSDIENFEYMTMEAYWGYTSVKDSEKWTAHICEKCIDEKFSFVNFKKENYF